MNSEIKEQLGEIDKRIALCESHRNNIKRIMEDFAAGKMNVAEYEALLQNYAEQGSITEAFEKINQYEHQCYDARQKLMKKLKKKKSNHGVVITFTAVVLILMVGIVFSNIGPAEVTGMAVKEIQENNDTETDPYLEHKKEWKEVKLEIERNLEENHKFYEALVQDIKSSI